jgi:prepilin-type N-terminal cleavage/methylation domain-containing protein
MHRRGLALIELLLVLVLLAIIASFAAPRLAGIVDGAAVRGETGRLVGALDAARGAAMRLGVVATLTLSDTTYTVTAIVSGDTITAWQQPGPWLRGVGITGAGQSILFGPAGLAMGVSNRTLVLSRGNNVRRVVVSRLGRLTY